MKSDLRKAFATERATLWHGDCANIASVIAPESIDAEHEDLRPYVERRGGK